jgi:hypothetical protein
MQNIIYQLLTNAIERYFAGIIAGLSQGIFKWQQPTFS